MMLSISHHLGDWTQPRAQAACGVDFNGITWTSTRNILWRIVVEKVSVLLIILKCTSAKHVTAFKPIRKKSARPAENFV